MSDLISREETVFIVLACSRIGNLTDEERWNKCANLINKLPSAELPKGELISRADAIEHLKNVKVSYPHADISLPIDLAIKAIEILPSVETSQNLTKPNNTCEVDLISRADAIDALCHNCAYYTDAQCKTDSGYWCESGAMIREDIPSAELPKGDMISRADAMAYIERVINSGLGRNKSLDYIHKYISALPPADTVSREFYEDAVKANIGLVIENRKLKEQIESADDVQGEWIDVNGDGSLWRCDQCKDTACCRGNFCPNCGADMKGEKNGDK